MSANEHNYWLAHCCVDFSALTAVASEGSDVCVTA